MKLNEVQGPNPTILVQGVGQYKLNQAIDNVRGKLEDLLQRANGPTTLENWQTIKALLEKQTLQAFVDSVAGALREIQ